MSGRPLYCTRCAAKFPEQSEELARLDRCPGCGARLQLALFPAWSRAGATGSASATAVAEGEANCFFHSGKRAVVPCDGCGRFLCALCDMEMNGKHFCPGCLETWSKKGRLQELERQRTRYDQVVWSLLVLPLVILWPVMAVTAGLALTIAIWKWKSPPSLVQRSKLALAIALPVAVFEIGLCLAFWLMALSR